jgi:SAM-dependent methyltransferase
VFLKDSMIDPLHLRTTQYANASLLQKRIALHQRYSTNSQIWYHWLFEQIEFPRRPRILDVGCGAGTFWNENRDRLPNGMSLTLTDLSAGMLESARSTLGDIPIACNVADAQSLPFANESFDLVIANHMLYHVPDTARAIREFRRVLMPGGRCIAATNGLEHMQELLALTGKGAAERPVMAHFSLENGAAKLEAAFANVERRDFTNDLEVTEVQPVIDYLESTGAEDNLTTETVQQARAMVSATIARDGHFRVRKSTGLFIAS